MPEFTHCKLRNGTNGYLIALGFNNQFNNQLQTLAENILLAKATKRTLVLTGFLEAASVKEKISNGGDYQGERKIYYPASSALDLHRSLDSISGLDWIDVEEYKASCPGPVDAQLHTFMQSWDPPWAESRAERDVYDWKLPEAAWPWDGNNMRNNPVPELSGLNFGHVHMIAYKSDKMMLGGLPGPAEMPVIATDSLFMKAECCVEPSLSVVAGMGTWGVLGRLHWAPPITSRANDFVNWAFGNRAFVAVHWRRGFLDKMEQRNKEDIVRLVKEAAERINTPHAEVYVASNQLDKEEMKALREAIGSGGVHSIVVEWGGNGDFAMTSRVEQAICLRAKAFINHPGSTWSSTVQAMRGWQQAQKEKAGKGGGNRDS